MQLAQALKTLEKRGNTFTIRHEDFPDGGQDTLVCTGKNNWEIPVKNAMLGYGMFVDAWLFDLDVYTALVQLYEHARGGHVDPAVTLTDDKGTLLGSIYRYAGDFNTAAFDAHKLWLLHSDAREHRQAGLSNFTGSCLMQIDLATAKLEHETPIQVPQNFMAAQKLAHGWLTGVGLRALDVKFAGHEGEVLLEVSVVNYQREKDLPYDSLRLPFPGV
jgi:hypothetical protein